MIGIYGPGVILLLCCYNRSSRDKKGTHLLLDTKYPAWKLNFYFICKYEDQNIAAHKYRQYEER